MIISFNTAKVQGGGSTALQQKKVTITENGLDVIIPDAGYDGLSTVYVKTEIEKGNTGGYKDFSVIGYDDELSLSINEQMEADIAYAKDIYDNWDENITDANKMFSENNNLVYFPEVNMSKVTDISYMFNKCSNLKIVPKMTLGKIKNMSNLFYFCEKLEYVDMSGNNFKDLTYNSEPFYLTASLTTLKFGYNLKVTLKLTTSIALSVESLLSVIDGLYDFTAAGETPTSTQGQLHLGSTNLAKLTDEQIAVATGRGWTVK